MFSQILGFLPAQQEILSQCNVICFSFLNELSVFYYFRGHLHKSFQTIGLCRAHFSTGLKSLFLGLPCSSNGKESACNAEDPGFWSLSREDPLEKGMAIHSNTLAWRISRTEEPGGLQSVGLQRVRHSYATETTWLKLCYVFLFLEHLYMLRRLTFSVVELWIFCPVNSLFLVLLTVFGPWNF